VLARSWPTSLAGQPSSLGGLDRINCGPQVFIAAIMVSAIRGAVKSQGADHAGWLSI